MNSTLTILIFVFAFSYQVSAQNTSLYQNPRTMNKNLKLEISVDKYSFCVGEKIWINYKIINNSNKPQNVLIFNYMRFPMGMSTDILDSNNVTICKYPSQHLLASQIFSEDQQKYYYKTIKPGKAFEDHIYLQDIPVFLEQIKDNTIPAGDYQIIITYYHLFSNKLLINIKE